MIGLLKLIHLQVAQSSSIYFAEKRSRPNLVKSGLTLMRDLTVARKSENLCDGPDLERRECNAGKFHQAVSLLHVFMSSLYAFSRLHPIIFELLELIFTSSTNWLEN